MTINTLSISGLFSNLSSVCLTTIYISNFPYRILVYTFSCLRKINKIEHRNLWQPSPVGSTSLISRTNGCSKKCQDISIASNKRSSQWWCQDNSPQNQATLFTRKWPLSYFWMTRRQNIVARCHVCLCLNWSEKKFVNVQSVRAGNPDFWLSMKWTPSFLSNKFVIFSKFKVACLCWLALKKSTVACLVCPWGNWMSCTVRSPELGQDVKWTGIFPITKCDLSHPS